MPVTFRNLYDHDAELNVDYYLNVHMPLVANYSVHQSSYPGHYGNCRDSRVSYEGAVTWAYRSTGCGFEDQECKADITNFVKKPAIVLFRQEVDSGKAWNFGRCC